MTNLIFKIPLKIYPFSLLLVIGEVEDKILLKYFSKEVVEKFREEDIEGYTVGGDKGYILLWCKDFPNSPRSLAILNHEIFHITFKVMATVGCYLDHTTEEPYAYLTQYISEQVYKKLKVLNDK